MKWKLTKSGLRLIRVTDDFLSSSLKQKYIKLIKFTEIKFWINFSKNSQKLNFELILLKAIDAYNNLMH